MKVTIFALSGLKYFQLAMKNMGLPIRPKPDCLFFEWLGCVNYDKLHDWCTNIGSVFKKDLKPEGLGPSAKNIEMRVPK